MLRITTSVPTVVAPVGVPLSFKFNIDSDVNVKKVQLNIRNRNVLGISTDAVNDITPNSNASDAIEIVPRTYVGRILTPLKSGDYEIYSSITDTAGTIAEEKIADLKIIRRLVINDTNHHPIEGAQVFISYFNHRNNKYEMLPPETFSIKNPSYSNIDGTVYFPLPIGKYQITIKAIGYTKTVKSFEIGDTKTDGYPIILLKRESFHVFSSIHYYGAIVNDLLQESKIYLHDLSNSTRFLKLNISVTVILFIVLAVRYLLQHRKNPKRSYEIRKKIPDFLLKILSMVFESLLIISLVFDVSLGFVLGWYKLLPFIFLSIITIALWIHKEKE